MENLQKAALTQQHGQRLKQQRPDGLRVALHLQLEAP